MEESQQYLIEVLQYPSMPDSNHIPNYRTVVKDNAVPSNDDNMFCQEVAKDDYKSNETIENDNTVDNECHFKSSYMPPVESPLGIYLKSVQKEISKCSSLKKKIHHPKSSPLQNLGRNPSPFKFYTNVLVYNFDPKDVYPSLNIEYECIYCGSKKVIYKGKRFRPAFSGSKIDWILYDRLQCHSACYKGGKGRNSIFGTIDPMFINKLHHPVADDFDYLFPNRGPGIKLDMVKMLFLFTDKHVLFGAFTKALNYLQWEH